MQLVSSTDTKTGVRFLMCAVQVDACIDQSDTRAALHRLLASHLSLQSAGARRGAVRSDERRGAMEGLACTPRAAWGEARRNAMKVLTPDLSVSPPELPMLESCPRYEVYVKESAR